MVSVAAFLMDRSEVTVGEYGQCVEKRACATPRLSEVSERWLCAWTKRETLGKAAMDCIEQSQAEAFCRARNKRLPTRHEWLRALRMEFPNPYLWQAEPPELRLIFELGPCWARGASCSVPHWSAKKDGFSDLVGNAREWSAKGEDGKKTWVLGLGWNDPEVHDPALLRLDQMREARSSSAKAFSVGFRCARD